LTRLHFDREGRVDDAQSPVKLSLVTNDDKIVTVRAIDQGVTKLRPHTGRFAGGDYERFGEGHSISASGH
jgi:hypothetical protein